jgi:hypothetical protein
MKRSNTLRAYLAVATLALAAGALGACKSDSPAEPPPPPPAGGGGGGGGGGTGPFSVVVTATPPTLEAAVPPDVQQSSQINIRIRNAAGQPPPPNTTVQVTASGGTLSGNGFSGETSVVLVVVNGEAVLFFTPSGPGTGRVTASLQGNSGSATIITAEGAGDLPFVLSNVQPGVGDPAGGEEVRIFVADGSRTFQDPVTVTFGGVNATVIGVGSRSIRVLTPARPGVTPGSTATVDVQVTNAAGTDDEAIDTLAGGFTYAFGNTVIQPQVFAVSPLEGPQEGNTRITVSGTGFQAPVQLIFVFSNMELEARLESVTATQIVGFSPDIRPFSANGTLQSPFSAQIRVVNQHSGQSATASQLFFYGPAIRITSVNPNEVGFDGGTRVLISGHGFDEPLTVTIDGFIQNLVSVSGSELVINSTPFPGRACDSRTSEALVVTNHEGGASATGAIFINGPPSPVITGILPITGTVGTAVTVSGSNFPTPASSARLSFGGSGGTGGSAATINSASAGSITGTVPTPPFGFEFATEACDGNGDGIPGGTRPIPTPMDVTVTNIVTGCFDTLVNGFTLIPSSTACTGDTSEPPPPPTTQCTDGFDNDGDTFIDEDDPQCTGPADNSESS